MNDIERVRFDRVFRLMPNGTIAPRRRVRMGGVSLNPKMAFARGVTFGGVDVSRYVGHDLQVEEKDDELVVRGIYK